MMDQLTEQKIVSLYLSGLSSREVSKLTNTPNTSVRKILARNNVQFRSMKTEDKVEEQIVEDYVKGESAESISKRVGLNASTIVRILKRKNIELRSLSETHKILNTRDDFLNVVDTEEKAYFLGFMYSDGNVHQTQNFIKIELHEQDIDILYKIINLLFIDCVPTIGYDPRIIEYEDESGNIKSKEVIYRYFTMTSAELKQDLIRLGCMPAKTFKIKLSTVIENIPKHLFHHFLRGFYDGDGSIALSKENDSYKVISCLTGFDSFLQEVKDYFKSELNLDSYMQPYPKHKNVSNLSISAQEDVVRILNYFYKDATIYLDRKCKKYIYSVETLLPKIEKRHHNLLSSQKNITIECFNDIVEKEKAYLFDFIKLQSNQEDYEFVPQERKEKKKKVRVDDSEIISLYQKDYTSRDISEMLKESKEYVLDVLKKNNITPNSNKTDKETEQKIIELSLKGESSESVSKILNISGSSVLRILKRNNIVIGPLSKKQNITDENEIVVNSNNIYNSFDVIVYNGKRLTKAYIQSLELSQKEEIAKYVFDYFREKGFPYEVYNDQELNDDFDRLINFKCEIENNNIAYNPNFGSGIIHHFCHHFYSVRNNSLPSMIDAFNNDQSLMNVIKNRMGITYKETFNITGDMIRQGIRNAYIGFPASSFKPSTAKAIYDYFAPTDSIVLDISAGFGQRMLGACSSKNVMKYIGIDPWKKQIDALSEIKSFLCLENVELHCVGSELFCPDDLVVDFCFSSPPFYNKEIYCDDKTQAYYNKTFNEFLSKWWEPTFNNVHKLLKKGGLFVVNMNSGYFDKMYKMCNNKFVLENTVGISFDRKHVQKSTTDLFFVLKKIGE